MKTEVMMITPEMAAKMLAANNPYNRSVSASRVRMYANDMIDGKWQLNGQAIAFNKDGVLIDGQHRLRAIILANVPAEMTVNTEVDNDVFLFDRGRTRTFKDTMCVTHKNISYPHYISACANAMCVLLTGKRDNGRLTDQAILDFYSAHQEDIDLAITCALRGPHERKLMRKAPVFAAFTIALGVGYDPIILSRFADVAAKGFAGPGEYAAEAFIQFIEKKVGKRTAAVEVAGFTDVTLQALKAFSKGIDRKHFNPGDDTTGWIKLFKENENNYRFEEDK